MDWEHWKQWYYKIITDFQYDPQIDLESAIKLNDLFEKRENRFSFKDLESLIRDKIIFVYGCGPSLINHVKFLKNSALPLHKFIHIAADGATSALLKYNIIPKIVVTDLDGEIADLITVNELGTIIIIHAHGDNSHVIDLYFPKFKGNILGTTQNKPLSFLRNYGGFTDGDRCVFLANEFGASVIILFGFDFGKIVGKYSKPSLENDTPANDIKLKKLHWAQNLIKELSNQSSSLIIRVGKQKMNIGKVKNYSFEELLEFLKNTDQD